MVRRWGWIGIDGGGTKTSAVLGDDKGNILAYAVSGSTNVQSVPFDKLKCNLKNLIDNLLQESEVQLTEVKAILFASAGGDRQRDKEILTSALDFINDQEMNVFIENDALAALASGNFGEPGMVLIAGTGSIGYNFSAEFKKTMRVGGWGHIFGDEGSGFDIGKQAVIAALKQLDGRGKETILDELIVKKLCVNHLEDIVPYFYQNQQLRSEVANLSKEVFQAAFSEDNVASSIVNDAIDHLMILVGKLVESSPDNYCLPLIICGGLFKSKWFTDKFHARIVDTYKNLPIVFPQVAPVVGSYIMSLKYSGININKEVKDNLLNSYESYMV